MRCEARARTSSILDDLTLPSSRRQCEFDATHTTPMGPMCDEHVEELRQAARSKDTMLGDLLARNEIEPGEWIGMRIRRIA
jgi:hypothetical protein